MKDILIIGGAGKLGFNLVEQLVDSSYSLTILDLKSNYSQKKLNKYNDKIKIIYGDIEDKIILTDLIKKNDIVINYAGIMPPFGNLIKSLSESINYNGTKNIVDIISKVNPNCLYIFLSFISIYGNTLTKKKMLTTKGNFEKLDDFYSISLLKAENYIKDNLSKFIIFRMPLVLTPNNYFINHICLNRMVDVISPTDMNKIIISSILNKKTYNKIFNISGFKINSTELISKIYLSSGNIKILNRNLYYGEYDDSDEIIDLTGIKCISFSNYLKIYKKRGFNIFKNIKKIFNYWKYKYIKNKK